MACPTNLVRLKCGCFRQVSIKIDPTEFPTRPQSPRYYLNRIYSAHNLPHDWKAKITSTQHNIPFLPSKCIRPFHFNDRLNELRAPTSPGLFAKYKTKSECLDDRAYVNFMRDYAHRIKDEHDKRKPYKTIPSRLFATPGAKQRADGTVKTRIVVGAPLPELGIENMFIRGFIDHLKTIPYVQSPETHHQFWCNRGSFGTDLKNSDTSMPGALVECALMLIRSRLRFTEYQGGAIPYSTTSLEKLWRHYVKYVLNTPVEFEGRIHYFNDGIPSGILATNLLTSLCVWLAHFCAHLGDCKYDLSQYGDNSVIAKCSCGFDVLYTEFQRAGLYLKYEPPNEHGCLIYCKTECHNGESFHSGQWFSNILNCVQGCYRNLTAFCLMVSSKPHPIQVRELLPLAEQAGGTRLHNRWSYYWQKFMTYVTGNQ